MVSDVLVLVLLGAVEMSVIEMVLLRNLCTISHGEVHTVN